jgi:HTH domain
MVSRPVKFPARRCTAAPEPPVRGSRIDERKAVTITRFAEIYDCSRATVWRALKSGRLRSIQIGSRKQLVLLSSVEPPA